MITADKCFEIFEKSVADYHLTDDVDAARPGLNSEDDLLNLLYTKNWIDTVQWHLEDIIRLPEINPAEALLIKRRIDKSNQDRTDLVEKIDDWFVTAFASVTFEPAARINSETPAWLLDRMSILVLKIYHMREQAERTDADEVHINKCKMRLAILSEQRSDMQLAFDELMEDIGSGKRRFKVYRQMKMYNDPSLNPVLYKTK